MLLVNRHVEKRTDEISFQVLSLHSSVFGHLKSFHYTKRRPARWTLWQYIFINPVSDHHAY